jgi:exodeoxyribonuclease VII large subunit
VTAASLPHYSISALNQAIGNLLERGFAPRFLLDATVSRPQLKKGHLWMTLSDGQASIGAVVWASQLAKLSHQPSDGDGVIVVGKLNFWANRASLTVQVLDLRPSLSTVLRQFEQVSRLLEGEGLLDPARKRPLPVAPQHIAVLTSVPSSALADLLRTARERWPSARVLVVPIPVQGAVEAQISQALAAVGARAATWGLEAVVLARGGGSREDLAVFDSEAVARAVAACPVPVITGVGHEDDTTVVDLVADHRAATPTGAMVALLPDRSTLQRQLERSSTHLRELVRWRLQHERAQLQRLLEALLAVHPRQLLLRQRRELQQQQRLLQALSPQHWLERGFSLIRNSCGELISSVEELPSGARVTLQLADGERRATIDASGDATMTQTSSNTP